MTIRYQYINMPPLPPPISYNIHPMMIVMVIYLMQQTCIFDWQEGLKGGRYCAVDIYPNENRRNLLHRIFIMTYNKSFSFSEVMMIYFS